MAPVANGSVFARLESLFEAKRDQPFILRPQEFDLSFGAVLAQSARYANVLEDSGARPGDRIIVKAEKSAEIISLYIACLRAGFVFLPLNPAFKHQETAHIVGDAAPAAIICPSSEQTAMIGLAPSVAILTLDADGSGTLAARAAELAPTFTSVPRAADDAAVILYTSGTTGFPKGAVLTHRNILANGDALVDGWAFTEDDVLLHCLPLFHSHGLFVSLSCSLLSASRLILCRRFEIGEVLGLLPRATVFMGVPTMYVRLAATDALDANICAGVRLFASGSAALSPDVFAAFERRTGHTILERYGMTETTINCANPLRGERRAGTVGLPLSGVEIAIADDASQPVSTGTTGRVLVRGAHVFSEYWRKPAQTREAKSADGWFDTGDLGRLDADGYLTLVGRTKDLIITGGYNVYPMEVETLLNRCAGIDESSVIGLPHTDYGEAVTAVVVVKIGEAASEETIRDYAKTHLASYKVPKRIVFLKSLPRNHIGKIEKTALRDRFRDLYAS